MKYIFMFLGLFVSRLCFAQEISINQDKSIVTFSLSSPSISYIPRWNAGYMQKIKNKIWAGLEIGYGSHELNSFVSISGESMSKEIKAYEIRPELFYNLNANSKLKNMISFELFYINHIDKLNNTWCFDTNSNSKYSFESADYRRTKYGFNLNYNLFFTLYNKILFILKTGIGVKQRNVSIYNISNSEPAFIEEDYFILPDFGGNNYYKYPGIDTNFNFNLDFKVAYKF